MVEPARGILLPVSASHPDPDTFCGWICAGSSFPHTATKGVGGDYLPWEVPLLKPVAAVAGSEVCAQGARLFIDGQAVAKRLGRDAMGRRMPWCPAAGGSEPGSRSCSMPGIRPRWSRRAIGFLSDGQSNYGCPDIFKADTLGDCSSLMPIMPIN